jgi:glycosyltransferase involved in cell wall biosynthesis
MRVLFLTGSPSTYMAPPRLAEEQIVAGPDWPDAQTPEGKWLSLRTPVGGYDLAVILARIPAEQRPDAVVSLVDASWRNQPRNTAAFRGPKALLIADTHHLASPLIGMFQYAATERYDRVVFLYDRHHLAFFQSLGFRNLSWFPGLTLPHDDATVQAARAAKRESRIAFIGQAGKFHPQRARLLEAMRAAGLPVDQRALPQREALRFYGQSLLGFNASLNGDLNLRVFETIATGAALLTDRLAPASGLLELFADGRELITYGSAGELAERAAHALVHPAETAAIGAAGAAWFDANFGAERRRQDFERLLLDGTPAARFELPLATRTRVFFGGENAPLLRTMMVYEGVQELHRTKESVRVALTPGVHEDVAAAFETLPRVEVVRGPLSTEADITVFTRDDDIVPAALHAPRVWCCDALPEEQATLNEFLKPAGFSPVSAEVAVLCRTEAEHPEQLIKKGFESGDAHLLLRGIQAREDDGAAVIGCLLQSIKREPNLPICWHALGLALCAVGRGDDGISALLRAVLLGKASGRLQYDLAELAIEREHGAIAVPAAEAAHAAEPGEATADLVTRARKVAADNAGLEPRDLLISHVEVTDRQGTGVLIKRLFPDASGFITVRSRSQHGGKVEFGGIQLSLDLPLPADVRGEILRRLLASYKIRRILALPYFAADFEHALVARTLTRAPLCTFVMDDQAVYCRNVPRELARKLFAASDLCLAISPEMAATYEKTFKRPFHFMPPVLSTAEDAVANHWTPGQSPANRVAMLGNVWTAKRFEQLREFVRRTGWQVDWYGPGPNASWLQVEPKSLAEDGIHCCGFLPEQDLIAALAGYSAVLIPSGMLDETEDNEAFSRLSLPSRMLFVLVKTRTPMLVLGSPKTAAGRFVLEHGIGFCTSFDSDEACAQLGQLADPARREDYAAAAARAAVRYVLPHGGNWIWESLATRKPVSAPFNSLPLGTTETALSSSLLLSA